MAQPATFLLQFQEPHPGTKNSGVSCGTQTFTETREGRDQDPRGLAPSFAGTETLTKTREDADQDRHLMATQTATNARETPDQDAGIPSYFAIPRSYARHIDVKR